MRSVPGGSHVPRQSRALGRRGQSLVEFALVLPVLLLILLIGLDVGRVFLGWVGLNGATRIGADFAARNPTAWDTANPKLTIQAEYRRLITAETTNIGCTLASIPDPTFPAGTDIGSPASVGLTCGFSVITPLISAILPNPLPVSASSSFPIRAGAIAGVPTGTQVPYATPSPTPAATPTPAPTSTPASTSTPAPTATPAPTPSPTPAQCTVPDFIGDQTSSVQNKWTNVAKFQTSVKFNPLAGPQTGYKVGWQSLSPGTVGDCATTVIEVRPQ